MNKDQANELKVGIMVLVCLGLGLTVAMLLSDWERWIEPQTTLTFKIPYQAGIGGIKEGWPVTIGGVSVGSVQEISSRLGPIDPRDVDQYPALEGEESQTVVEEETQEPTQGAQGIAETRTYSYFTFTVPSKYKLYEDCELKPAGQIIGGAGELVISNFGSKGKLLKDGDEVFRKDLGKSSMAVVMDKAQQVIAKAQEVMDRIGKITEDFKSVSGNIRQTVSMTKPQLEKIVANIRIASEEMKQGMREIRWNPWRLLHNPSDRELRTQNLLTAARSFSSGASDLDTAADKLEGLLEAREGNIASDDPELVKMVEELKATVAKFKEAEKTFFKRLGKGK